MRFRLLANPRVPHLLLSCALAVSLSALASPRQAPSAAPGAQESTRQATTTQLLELGNDLLKQGDVDGAIAQYTKALITDPEDFRAHRAMGDAFYRKRIINDAIDEYRQAIRLKPEDASSHAGLAQALFAREDLLGATTEFREALRLDPNSAPAHRAYAVSLRTSGNIERAAAEFRAAVRLDPMDAAAQRGLGDCLVLLLDDSAAIAALRESIRLDPNNAFAHRRLGNVLSRQQQVGAALASYRESLRLNPNDVGTHGDFGNALVANRDFDEAIAQFRETTRLNPDSPLVRRLAVGSIAMALIEAKRFAEAFAELQPAIEKDPNDAGLQFTLGVAKLRSGQADDGLAAFGRGLRLAPSVTSYNNVAYELARSGVHLDTALSYAQNAVNQQLARIADFSFETLTVADIRTFPALSAYWDTLGWVYFQMKQMPQAEEFLLAAWSLSQRAPMADHLGQLYEKNGDRDRAIRFYAMALAASGTAELQDEIRARLDALSGADKAGEAIDVARNELRRSRMVEVPRTVAGPSKADFLVLFIPNGNVRAVRFIVGSTELQNATDVLVSAKYDVIFPDAQPAKIVRRGTLNCPPVGDSCQFMMMSSELVTSIN